MRFANVRGRAHLQLSGDTYVDVAEASGGAFDADPMNCLRRWDDLLHWARDRQWDASDRSPAVELGSPVPDPGQIFAIGLNYQSHVDESGLGAQPSAPLVFTKFPASMASPVGPLELPTDTVDWEVELVVVIGRPAYRVAREDAWSVVAGLTLGQDYSERTSQMVGSPAQFSLAKSYPGFTVLGPVLVTPEEFADLDDIRLGCAINGTVVQDGRTSDLMRPIPDLIAHLSSVCPLRPGDLVFTGTPDGTGMGMNPPRYLRDGDEVVSSSPEIGELRQACVRA